MKVRQWKLNNENLMMKISMKGISTKTMINRPFVLIWLWGWFGFIKTVLIDLQFIYLSHTQICHQPRIGPCGRTINSRNRRKKNPKIYLISKWKIFLFNNNNAAFSCHFVIITKLKFYIIKFFSIQLIFD